MKFRVALRNHRTQLHEIEHSVMSFAGISRILGTICERDPEELASVMEAVINRKRDTFQFGGDGMVADKWEIIIQVLE